MSDLNKVLLIGRLGVKPELKQTAHGPMTRLRVATSYERKTAEGQSERDTDWHAVVVFGRQAELCVQHLDKGRLVYVEGHLQSNTWKDKEGRDHTDREVRARQVTFLTPKPQHAGESVRDPAPLF